MVMYVEIVEANISTYLHTSVRSVGVVVGRVGVVEGEGVVVAVVAVVTVVVPVVPLPPPSVPAPVLLSVRSSGGRLIIGKQS